MECLPAEGDPQQTIEEAVAQDVAFIAYAGQWLCSYFNTYLLDTSFEGIPQTPRLPCALHHHQRVTTTCWWSPRPPPALHHHQRVAITRWWVPRLPCALHHHQRVTTTRWWVSSLPS